MATRFPNAPQPANTIEAEINQFFDRIVACVDYRRRTLIAEANEKRENIRARCVRREESERQLLAMKSDTERNLKENVLRGTQEKILSELKEKLAEVRLPHSETRLVFQGDSGQLEKLVLGLGEVLEQEVPVVPTEVQVVPPPIVRQEVVPRYQQMRSVIAVGKEGLGDGDIRCPQAVTIDESTSNIYVAQGSVFSQGSARVSIFSESGEFLNSFGQEDLKEPCGIALHANSVYVTENSEPKVLKYKQDSDIRLVASAGRYGSGNGKFKYPTQVSVSTDGDVYVVDRGNHRIQILNSSLHFLRLISDQAMHWPHDIKLTQDEVYVLSTCDSPCIHVFSHNGDKIRSLITRTRGDGMQVTRACYFCLDAGRNIIISDHGAHCIKIFSPQGTLMHKIGERGHEKEMLEFPKGIALTKDLKLVVLSYNEKYGLQIFPS